MENKQKIIVKTLHAIKERTDLSTDELKDIVQLDYLNKIYDGKYYFYLNEAESLSAVYKLFFDNIDDFCKMLLDSNYTTAGKYLIFDIKKKCLFFNHPYIAEQIVYVLSPVMPNCTEKELLSYYADYTGNDSFTEWRTVARRIM